jgi:hypothetical protein
MTNAFGQTLWVDTYLTVVDEDGYPVQLNVWAGEGTGLLDGIVMDVDLAGSGRLVFDEDKTAQLIADLSEALAAYRKNRK